QGPGQTRTYFHQPGVVVDALSVTGCEQAAPERFGELTFLIGRLNMGDFTRSALHLFQGEVAQIVSDGSDGGAAVVRFMGSVTPFWLAELELTRSALENGNPRELTAPLGVRVTVDYVLAPGSSVL